MSVFIKICGVTRPEEIRWAAAAGADAVGFVFAPSRRRITLETARALSAVCPHPLRVGVFKDCAAELINAYARTLNLDYVQVHGRISGALEQNSAGLIRALTPGPDMLTDPLARRADYLLLDGSSPGSGRPFPWEEAAGLLAGLREAGQRLPPLIIAGGLTAANVKRALQVFRPAGVDVSSGVEVDGVKSRAKITEFVQTVRRWEKCLSSAYPMKTVTSAPLAAASSPKP